MRYIVIAVCLFVSVYGIPPELVAKIKEEIMRVGGECKGEVSATDDDIAVLKNRQLPTTQNGKCFIACMNKKFGFQDASGKIDKAEALSMIEKLKPFDEDLYVKMRQVNEKCLTEVTDAADECETAVNMMACYQRENKAAGIEPIEFD